MADSLQYMTGFGGHFESEAVAGALPKGRNSPQRPAFGLYTEQLSGSSFTSPRHENRRSWLYRMRPTADHRPFERYEGAPLFDAAAPLEPLASNGLANPRDFETPVASFEDKDEPTEVIQKSLGSLWTTTLDHSSLDVVAWHGNLAPYRYDLSRFNTIGTISFDHPDPSIFTVLTSPSDVPGRANADFVIFPPRWMVGEDTFRPPWFHRNVMSEAMGLIHGAYDAKAEGFAPGGLSLHNLMSGHGPDVDSWRKASEAELKPVKIEASLAFMVESCWPYRPTQYALERAQPDYDQAWAGFPKAKLP